MVGGATWPWWIGFHLAVIALLVVDSFLPGHHGKSKEVPWVGWAWTALLAIAALGFAAWIAVEQGHVPAIQFVAGYAIELSLSVDNLFVFLVLFQGFRISALDQHHVLLWGVAGAVVMRAMFIAAGVALLNRFSWITYIFGLMLLYGAWRLLRGGSAKAAIPEWIRRMQPVKGSLLPVILAVEVTDLIFAVDSIPAVLAVSKDPFIVYTSNIAAILGLRSLYFVLASLLGRFHYLHYGLGVLLAFIAVKMMVAHFFEIPITLSLAIIGAILVVCGLMSFLIKAPAGHDAHGTSPQ